MSTLPNIIFLDMDGCLVTERAEIAMGYRGGGFGYLDPIACNLVKRLCQDYNAWIVISSAWRQEFEREAMQAILNAACQGLGNLIWPSHHWWRTSCCAWEEGVSDTSDRGREIKNWIDMHETKFNNFCIIDDMADMRPLQDSLVKCNTDDGIGLAQYLQAVRLLIAPPYEN